MPSTRTYLKVINNTPSKIRTQVSNIDHFDWVSANRPNNNFHNIVIEANAEAKHPQDINTFASANLFTLDLIFEDRTSITLRIDQGIAAGRKQTYAEYLPQGLADVVNKIVGISGVVNGVASVGDVVYTQFQNREREAQLRKGGDNKTYSASLSVVEDTVVVDVH